MFRGAKAKFGAIEQGLKRSGKRAFGLLCEQILRIVGGPLHQFRHKRRNGGETILGSFRLWDIERSATELVSCNQIGSDIAPRGFSFGGDFLEDFFGVVVLIGVQVRGANLIFAIKAKKFGKRSRSWVGDGRIRRTAAVYEDGVLRAEPFLHARIFFAEHFETSVQRAYCVFQSVVAAVDITEVVGTVLELLDAWRGERGDLFAGFQPVFTSATRIGFDVRVWGGIGFSVGIYYVGIADATNPKGFSAELLVFGEWNAGEITIGDDEVRARESRLHDAETAGCVFFERNVRMEGEIRKWLGAFGAALQDRNDTEETSEERGGQSYA